jgi:hypothetical protein
MVKTTSAPKQSDYRVPNTYRVNTINMAIKNTAGGVLICSKMAK